MPKVPEATRHLPNGQDVFHQGRVQILRGYIHIGNKKVFELSKVTKLSERSSAAVAVRLQHDTEDWLQVVFDSSGKAEGFRRDVEAKMRTKTSREEKTKVEKENVIVKHPVNAAKEQASDRVTPLPLKRIGVPTPSEGSSSKICRRETPEKVALAGLPELKEPEESFVAMVESWKHRGTHDSEGAALSQRERSTSLDSTHSSKAGDREEHTVALSASQAVPAAPDTEQQRSEEWVSQQYEFGAVLEKTASSEVRVATGKNSKHELVLKRVNKKVAQHWLCRSRTSRLSERSEAKLLKDLKHPNIIELHDFFETEMHVYLIMEYAPAGDLLKYLITYGHLQEEDARRLFHELCDAVRYLHSKDVVHRDLKLSNILLTDVDPKKAHVKVADLGVSRKARRVDECHTVCGTLDYLAPEVLELRAASRRPASRLENNKPLNCPASASKVDLEGGYGLPADMWSLGVVLYMMLCGQPPFDGHQGDTLLCQQIKDGTWEFDVRPWKSISRQAKDLINNLLVQDPDKRFTIKEVFEHRWLQDAGT
mmetsp:Transcript_53971/g.101330  ORF Transcript_53971/g.101330 Transcript_53971/m.101330 type:complete len:538 (+) Transcript_53971:138-1751(+)